MKQKPFILHHLNFDFMYCIKISFNIFRVLNAFPFDEHKNLKRQNVKLRKERNTFYARWLIFIHIFSCIQLLWNFSNCHLVYTIYIFFSTNFLLLFFIVNFFFRFFHCSNNLLAIQVQLLAMIVQQPRIPVMMAQVAAVVKVLQSFY